MSHRGQPVTTGMREAARERAEKRNAIWAQLSPKEQLETIDRRLGEGVGAKKQRARLQKRLAPQAQEKLQDKRESSKTKKASS